MCDPRPLCIHYTRGLGFRGFKQKFGGVRQRLCSGFRALGQGARFTVQALLLNLCIFPMVHLCFSLCKGFTGPSR